MPVIVEYKKAHNQTLNVRINDELNICINEMAQELNMTKAQFVRMAINNEVDRRIKVKDANKKDFLLGDKK